MKRRTFVKTIPAATIMAGTASGYSLKAMLSGDLQPIPLPPPEKDGGKSVLAALQERKTTRNISSRELPLQVLSNLLWAAFGVNREQASFNKPGRTAPSASNSQEIDLYVALPGGVYLYDAVPHRLEPVNLTGLLEILKFRNHTIIPIQVSLLKMHTCSLPHKDLQPGSTTVTKRTRSGNLI